MSLLADAPPELEHRIEEQWADAPGIVGFLTSVDHKRVGIRYIYTAFAFFFLAGLLALVMRSQLAQPDSEVVDPDTFNQLFTMHGTLMIFFFNTPVLAGFGNYLLPLMLGTRDVAFPRLNAFSYWIFLVSGAFVLTSFLVGDVPDGGWFAYTPYTLDEFTPSKGIDFWGLGVVFTGISTTAGAINFAVTIFKLRAPGMTLDRMPLFVWSMLVFAFMVVFAVPAITLAAGLLELDRLFGTRFFDPEGGGSTLLYQHLFWFWGHPEVYILFLPASGMISTIIPVFSRRRIAGYLWVATSFVAIGFISFGVWVHHMFATGIPSQAMSFFAAASLIIAIPSGVQFFAWIATMWGARIRFTTPMLFSIGFLLVFLAGGITGVMVAVMPFDWQATDTYFVVAHFHYVLNGAVVFPVFAALYYWLPKMTGRLLDERLGKISFWMMFVAFNVAFFPMHVLGLLGMPRRIYTYAEGLGWETLNVVVSIGSGFFGLGTALTLVNFLWSRRRWTPAPADPWEADTLEWSVPSPAPHQNFTTIPVVGSRHPLWDAGGISLPDPGDEPTLGVEGTLTRSTPWTSGMDTRPEAVLTVPQPTYVPVLTAIAIGVVFTGLIMRYTFIWGLGLALVGVGVLTWTWRTEEDLR